MNLRVKFTFKYNQTVDGETAEYLCKLLHTKLTALLQHGEDKQPTKDEQGRFTLTSWQTYEADIQDLLTLNIPFEVNAQADSSLFTQLITTLVGLERKVDNIAYQKSQFNERVSVHIPGFALLEINEVKVVTDLCSDNLQEQLDSGWRILAICPQPDQRRPDYVFGRTRRADG